MKGKRIIFIAIWALLIIVYIMDGSYETGFLLAFYCLMCIVNGVLCLLSGRSLQIELHMPYGMEKNEAGDARIQITNLSMIPVVRGEMTVAWENTLTREHGEFLCPFGLMPKGNISVDFSVEARYCGQFRAQIASLRVFDVFRIFSGKRKGSASGQFFIFPEVRELEIQIAEKETYDMESFRYSEERKGDDSSEVFDIREYMAGDSMKNIHWKLTGKLGNIMVKEPGYPVFNSIMVLLETGCEGEAFPAPERMDEAVETSISIARNFLEQETPFEIGLYDYEKETFCSERIEDAESLWNMIPEMLAAGRSTSQHSAYYQYLASAGNRRFAHYVYVAADDSFNDVEMAAEVENFTIVRCGNMLTRDGR